VTHPRRCERGCVNYAIQTVLRREGAKSVCVCACVRVHVRVGTYRWLCRLNESCVTVQRSTAHHSTLQRSTAQHSVVQCSATEHSTVRHNTAQLSIAQHSTMRHNTVQHSKARHGTAWQNKRHSTCRVRAALTSRCTPENRLP
jgi:hypothetical protein